jgi:hypothetical protein
VGFAREVEDQDSGVERAEPALLTVLLPTTERSELLSTCKNAVVIMLHTMPITLFSFMDFLKDANFPPHLDLNNRNSLHSKQSSWIASIA